MVSKQKKIFFISIFLLVSVIFGCFSLFSNESYGTQSDFEVHFPELGNAYTGDCTYIKAGNTDILIDAGSNSDSVPYISAFLDKHVKDGKLEYVIITHAHNDHYACFAVNETEKSLFDLYKCDIIIDFPRTNQTENNLIYKNYLRELNEETENGAKHLTALDVIEENEGIIQISENTEMKILDQKYYHEYTENENNYSVCLLFTHFGKNFLFTGDLEKDGEISLMQYNKLPEIDLYKAGHHGSKTSSCPEFMAVIKPKIVCVSCCAGSPEHANVSKNQFPSQQFINNIAPYTDKVYITSLCTEWQSGNGIKDFKSFNGTISVYYLDKNLKVLCSETNEILKNSDWFINNRVCPENWK